jgi:hypothetical protein
VCLKVKRCLIGCADVNMPQYVYRVSIPFTLFKLNWWDYNSPLAQAHPTGISNIMLHHTHAQYKIVYNDIGTAKNLVLTLTQVSVETEPVSTLNSFPVPFLCHSFPVLVRVSRLKH